MVDAVALAAVGLAPCLAVALPAVAFSGVAAQSLVPAAAYLADDEQCRGSVAPVISGLPLTRICPAS
ncbi:hypothetical protein AB0L10_44500 [Streptomyces flaveolus]|uniref:hypothetical protein n=1 Tax=Streptomyces flaveolus TaxID=67297 RepID=UPI00341BDF92